MKICKWYQSQLINGLDENGDIGVSLENKIINEINRLKNTSSGNGRWIDEDGMWGSQIEHLEDYLFFM